MMNRIYFYIAGGTVAVLVLGLLLWSLNRSATEEVAPAAGFGVGDNRSVVITEISTTTNQPLELAGLQQTAQPIFKIADGPVAGATLVEQYGPTTTVARFVRQDTGHIFDLTLDIPGATLRARSNTTIPGIQRVVWVQQGNGAVLQYLDADTIKSVYVGLPVATTSTSTASSRPARIQFLPDNIREIAASPDGSRIAYLLQTENGITGYTASVDGSGSATLFSLPFKQVTLQWPATSTLLVTTKSAAGTAGAAFTINSTSGLVTPIISANGLTVIADQSFSNILYQAATSAGSMPLTYIRDIQAGQNQQLSFEPAPERCIWSAAVVRTLYCPTSLQTASANFLDLWRLGAASIPDNILKFDLLTNQVPQIIAIPGSQDGGVPADIAEMALAPGERYLSYITRVDRTLWGVRLPMQ